MEPVLENRPLIRCEPQYGAIVCLTCNNAFPKTSIARHLRDTHHFRIDLYRPILESIHKQHGKTLADDWSKLKLSRPIDGSAPIEGLKIRPGYACTGCEHRTTGDYVVRGHSNCARAFRRVDLQCWNMNGAPAYWIVCPSQEPPIVNGSSQAGTFAFSDFIFIYIYIY